jgi:hypothetical protein
MQKISKFVVVTLFASLIFAFPQQSANAGLFDCVKPKKWSGYSQLRTAFMKDPQKKSEDDWFRAYVFARIYTGSPKCFQSKDVAVMKKWVKSYNQACIQNPSWNFSCEYYSGTSTFQSWVYEGYK